jgi:oligopeptide/dipeptide ABC transporter ATP-binding protein
VKPESQKVLEIRDLKTYFDTPDGVVKAVDGVSCHVREGEVLGLVGESGCGKTVTCLSVMRLLQAPPARFPSGEVYLEGTEILRSPEEVVRGLRGNRISMVFQEPMTALNPVLTIGDQVSEVLVEHRGMGREDALGEVKRILAQVGLSDPDDAVKRYPHELSGGMRQRIMIGMAMACKPAVLLADEPTTALDVSIQAQILDLLMAMKEDTGMAVILVTHDLGVIAGMADRVAVMYAGRIVEEAPVDDLFDDPLHPYTGGLLRCIPRMDRVTPKLDVIAGLVPHPLSYPAGCRYHPRCVKAMPVCREEVPSLAVVGDERKVACWAWSKG